MTLKVMTFGSCFAAFVANCLWRLSGMQRCCSVQHTRIDQFNAGKPILRRETTFVPKAPFDAVLANQFDDEAFGKSLPYGLPPNTLLHPNTAIDAGVDVLIIDNFADVLFRISRNPATGQMLYAHSEHMQVSDPNFSEPLTFIDPVAAISGYVALHNRIRERNPAAVSIFLNFPMNLKGKPKISARSEQFESASLSLWRTPGFGVIDLTTLELRDLNKPNDSNHFSKRRYLQYAYQVSGLIQMLRCDTRSLPTRSPPLFGEMLSGKPALSIWPDQRKSA